MYLATNQHEGPADHCVIHGVAVGWVSCTAYGMATTCDQSTAGGTKPTGCALRTATGDTSGGQTIYQIASVLGNTYGIRVEVYTGSNVTTPAYAYRRLAADRPFVVQGNTAPLVGTIHKSTENGVNHLVGVLAGRAWSFGRPRDVLIGDPAADHRRPDIAGPGAEWWPVTLLERFAANLHPWGEGDPRTLGYGKFYAGIYPATPQMPDTSTETWVLHIKPRAKLRIYTMQKAQPINCIKSWVDDRWGSRGSHVVCTRPVHRPTCDGQSGAVTVKVLSPNSRYFGKYLLVGSLNGQPGTYVTEV